MKKSIISISLALALLGGCASSPSISDSDVFTQYPTIQEASALLESAKSDNLAFFAPQQMKEARRVYESAIKDAKAGKTSASTLATEAVARAKAARVQTQKVKYTFEDVLAARDKAIKVNASSVAKEQFADAENDFSKAISLLEIGEEDKAKRDIEALKNQYLAIELNALKKNMLSFAQKAVADADKNDLDDIAPRTVLQAKDELKLAKDTLEANRTDTAKANVHSNKAIWLIQRAEGIADINAYFENADFDEEQQILWYQEQLSKVVAAAEPSVQFNNTNKEVVSDLGAKVATLVNDNESLLASLNAATLQLQQVTSESEQKIAQITSNSQMKINQLASESELKQAELEKEKADALMKAQLERETEQAAKRADDERFAQVQSMFAENEATVYRQRDNVLIRAQGFAFKSGGSEIESSNFVMLNKITEAIKRFPNSTIVVSGHTDATGSAELNLALSKARAETVSNFITQVSEIDASRVTANGFGKEKPVASNENAEGRAQNRRVEILIVNK